MEITARWVVVAAVVLAAFISLAPSGGSVTSGQTEQAAVDQWFRRLRDAKPKFTKLHFFIQDILAGPNFTIVQVAGAENVTDTLPSRFGLINVIDAPLTEGPGMDSKEVGRVEGLYVSASKKALNVLVANNFVFTAGKYNGSTLSVLGRVVESSLFREFSITGGMGEFRMAQGIATAMLYSVDSATGNMVVECRMQFLHY